MRRSMSRCIHQDVRGESKFDKTKSRIEHSRTQITDPAKLMNSTCGRTGIDEQLPIIINAELRARAGLSIKLS